MGAGQPVAHHGIGSCCMPCRGAVQHQHEIQELLNRQCACGLFFDRVSTAGCHTLDGCGAHQPNQQTTVTVERCGVCCRDAADREKALLEARLAERKRERERREKVCGLPLSTIDVRSSRVPTHGPSEVHPARGFCADGHLMCSC